MYRSLPLGKEGKEEDQKTLPKEIQKETGKSQEMEKAVRS
jgi:hypothetical protein